MASTRRRIGGRPFAVLALLTLALGTGCAKQAPADPSADSSVQFPANWKWSADVKPVTAQHGMVATVDDYATQAGLQVLKDGGNAVDAAVTVSLVLAVVHSSAGNIGGGGFMVLRNADGTTAALDYREKAPLKATHDMYLDKKGNLTNKSLLGPLSIGVPGSVAGLWAAHQRYGKMDWKKLVQPAIDLADGYVVRQEQHRMIAGEADALRDFPTTASIFLPGGKAPAVGDTLHQPDLAATLRRLQKDGPDDFYRGKTADLIVAEMKRDGGLITHKDLEQYQAKWRKPVRFDYRGYKVISMPPPSSGGATMAEIGNILNGYDLSSMPYHSTEMVHLMAEADARGFIDRNTYLADPDFVDVPTDQMSDSAYGAKRRQSISLTKATPVDQIKPGLGPAPKPRQVAEHLETTHFSIVDGNGDAVAVTTTLNFGFGSKVTVKGAGIVLNDEMDDFASKPGSPNGFGLVQGEANSIQPGKRMLSSMSPTVVLDPQGKLFMVTGTPGGSTIITTTFQTISNVIDYGMNAAQAVDAPRIHDQHLPDKVFVEKNGLPQAVIDSLEAMGHHVDMRNGYSGQAATILVRKDGMLEGAADPRSVGSSAAGY